MDFKNTYSGIFGGPQDPKDLKYMDDVDKAMNRKGHPWAFLLSVAIVVFVVVAMVWASFAIMDETTRGMGHVIPSQGVQLIQNQEGGTIREMVVRETQTVEEGDVLARIQVDDMEATLRDVQHKLAMSEVALIRLQAERAGQQPEFPQKYIEQYPGVVADQQLLYEMRDGQFDAEDRALQAQLEQRKREVEAVQSKVKSLEESLTIAREKERNVRSLAAKGTYSQMDYLNLKQSVVSLEGELDGANSSLSRAQSAVRAAEEQFSRRNSERMSAILSEITRTRIDINSFSEQIISVRNRATRAELRAPMKGIIKRILVKQGAVAKAGETIIELLPIEDTLEVEARISPADIGFLHPGQKAMVKITAYDFSIFGGLEADLIQISADTIEDKRGELYYMVRLRTRKNALHYQGRDFPIIPGMTVSVDILTGQKSVLDYVLAPIIKAKDSAFTER